MFKRIDNFLARIPAGRPTALLLAVTATYTLIAFRNHIMLALGLPLI